MSRSPSLFGLALAACASPAGETVSSMNYLMEPLDPACAQGAILETDGYAVRGPLRKRGGASEFTALFNDDLPVRVIIRRQGDGSSEVSAFTRLAKDANPLERREAEFAVERADEAIYLACTADGREHGTQGDVVIEAE